MSILETFLSVLHAAPEDVTELVLEYLRGFPTVARFGVVLMFLSPKEQKIVQSVWEYFGQTPGKGLASEWVL